MFLQENQKLTVIKIIKKNNDYSKSLLVSNKNLVIDSS